MSGSAAPRIHPGEDADKPPATWRTLLAGRAAVAPEALAYRFLPDATGAPEQRLSRAELYRRATALAARLGASQREPGAALLVFPPGLDYVVALFACLCAGVAAVPAYPPQRPRALPRWLAIAHDARPRWVLTSPELRARWQHLVGEPLASRAWLTEDEEDEIAGDVAPELAPITGTTLALLQYTSGSTARPKGVKVDHARLLAHSEQIWRRFGMADACEVVSWLPPYHDMGLVGGILQPLYAGVPATLLSPFTFLRRPLRWLQAISGRRGVVSGGPDFAYELTLRRTTAEERRELDLAGWRVAFNGAEPVRAETLERFAAAFAAHGFDRKAFFPCYGLAEAVLMASGGEPAAPPLVRRFDPAALERGEARPAAHGRALVGCGRALEGHALAVTDTAGRPCPERRIGEIRLAGPTLALGYWRRPRATARTFLDAPGGPWLRTGDLGFLDGGELFVTGRIKDLVIVRGRNLAPADLEATAAQSHLEVLPGAVAAFSVDTGEQERLVIVAELGRRALGAAAEVAAAIRRAIAESWQVEAHEVLTTAPGRVPRTTSGKVRRRACRRLYLAGRLEAAGSARPLPTREPALATATDDVLGVLLAHLARLTGSTPSAHTELAELALDSLRAAELCRAVESELGVAPALERVLAGDELGTIAAELAERLGGGRAPEPPRPRAEASQGPLAPGQEPLWRLSRLDPRGAANNVFSAARLTRPLAPERVHAALCRLLERHAALRTCFPLVAGAPVRRSLPRGVPAFEWCLLPAPTAGLEEVLDGHAHRAFDLENGPLLRLCLVLDDDGLATAWLWVAHHLVVDLASLGTLFEELALLLADRALPTAPAASYDDFVAWQHALPASAHGARLLAFWREQLAEPPPPLELPTDRARPALRTEGALERRRALPAWQQPPRLADGRRPTAFGVFATMLGVLLHRLGGQRELVVGFPTAGRLRPEHAGLVGYLVNLLPLRLRLAPELSFEALLAAASRRLAAVLAHQELPLPVMIERFAGPRDPARTPLFDAVVVLQDDPEPARAGLGALAIGHPGARCTLGGLELEAIAIEHRAAVFDLTLTLAPLGMENEPGWASPGWAAPGWAASLLLNRDLFDAVTAERLLERFEVLLGAALAHPATRLAELPVLTAAETRQLEAGPRRPAAVPTVRLEQLLAAQTGERPDAIALGDGEQQLSYGELGRRAETLARRLRAAGAGPETRVGLCLEPSCRLVETIVAVLRAGAAYLPLDPDDPPERLARLCADAAPVLVVTQGEAAQALATSGVAVLDPDAESDEKTRAPAPSPLLARPENAAYVIYTSGSTGTPKGVVISHVNVVRLLVATRHDLGFGSEEVWSMLHSAAFDFSVWELWGALAHGARLEVVPRMLARAPRELLEHLETKRVSVLCQTPTACRQLLTAAAGAPPPALGTVIFGGEALEPHWLAPWLGRAERPRLLNMYGITETTVHVTCRELGAGDLDLGALSPIGEPIADLVLRLLDARGRPVPTGVVGEIHVGGPGLARGYLGRPAPSAERFVPDAWAASPGERLYRSGDLARRTSGGELVFLGRADGQVKIRGFRIELGEIEAALAAHPGVRTAVVLARALPEPEPAEPEPAEPELRVAAARTYLKRIPGASPAGKRLVAWVVAASDPPPRAGELRGFLAARLPAHCLPAAFVSLAALPLTRNGKLDTRALPAPGAARPELGTPFTPPSTPTERALAAIWEEVLGLERVGLDDDFFALGGDSISSLRVQTRAAERGLRFELAVLYHHPSVRRLAARLEARPETARREPTTTSWEEPPLPPGIEAIYPLSRMQAGLLYHSEQHPGSSVYRASFLYRLRGALEPGGLHLAAAEVAARHAILRTRFDLVSFREPMQLVHRQVEVPFAVCDLRRLRSADHEGALERWLAEERRRDFDWRRAPLLRLALILLEDGLCDLGITCHDAILDGWSTSLLIDELLTRATTRGTPRPALTPPAVTYRDFVALERTALADPAEHRFWATTLDGATATRVPRRHGDGAPRPPHLGVVDVPIPEPLDQALQALARRAGTALKHVALAAHLRVLQVLTGDSDVITGLEANGRPESAEAEQAVGQFLNTVPLRQRLGGGSWLELVAACFENERALLPHRRFPYAEIQKRHGRPLYETTFNYTHFHLFRGFARRSGLEVVGGRGRELTHYALKTEVNRDPFDDRLQLDVVFDQAVISRAQARTIGALYLRALRALAAEPAARYEAVSLLGPAERHQLLAEQASHPWRAPWPGATLPELIAERARRCPEAIAVAASEGQLSYGELARRAAGLAARLTALGAGPETVVGVATPRSLELMIALVGVLAAGAAYLPLEPDQPHERLLGMAEQAFGTGERAVVVIHGPSAIGAALAARGARLVGALAADPATALAAARRRLEPEHPAYVLFTSGSTGRPKGVVNTHRGIVHRLGWMHQLLGLGTEEAVLQKTPLGFDVSVWELFWPLAVGARLVLAPPGAHLEPALLAAAIARERVSTLHFVPSLLGPFLGEPAAGGVRTLRRVVASGEALESEHVRRFEALFPARTGVALWNLYGPTEAAVDVTLWRCDPHHGGSVPIGRAAPGVVVDVLDAAGLPAPIGARGELFLGGVQLARGYLGRPALTAERFVPDPAAGRAGRPAGARLYRSGDLGARRPDGVLEIAGRSDQQVKIRGQRIEPGEVEALLATHPAVQEAAVVVVGERPEHRRLAAFVVLRGEAPDLDGEVLRSFLGTRLPRAMVPALWHRCERLPRTASGKLDRKALHAETAPRDEEARLAALLDQLEALSDAEAAALAADPSPSPAGEPPR